MTIKEQNMDTMTRIPAIVWAHDEDSDEYMQGEKVDVEIERTESNEIAMHTFIDGQGSKISYYWTREQAIEMAQRLLTAALLR